MDWSQSVHPGWLPVLQPVADELAGLSEFLEAESAVGRSYLPGPEQIFRALTRDPAEVSVVLIGQDPYPTPGHAVGLSFSIGPDVAPLPRSLVNIFREYEHDLSLPDPTTGDLSPWHARGVLLLNRVLTVRPGMPGSHRGKGWEQVTEAVVAGLVARQQPFVALLWGKDAQQIKGLGATPRIESVHPSPLSAHRGFFGSRPFTRVNAQLELLGCLAMDWRLP